MINAELLDEIIYISLKNEYISKELIEKIVLSIIEKCDDLTQNQFGGLYFDKLEWDFAIAALDENCRIVANYEEMISLCKFENNQSYLEKNLKTICYLLHEIEHLKEDSKTDFEAKILKCGSGNYIYEKLSMPVLKKINNIGHAEKIVDIKYKKFYEKNWSIIPCERIAEITARKNILSSLINYPNYDKNFFTEYKNLTKFYINGLRMAYPIREYEVTSSPLYRFFKSIGDINNFNSILSSTSNIATEEKMIYGFPIKPKDMIEINKMKIKSRR